MINKLLLTSAICAAFIVPVGVEAVQAEVKSSIQSSKLIAQVLRPLRIRNFTVNPVDELPPGTELVFTLQGTPNAEATFSIGDVVGNLPMEEIQFGVYEGRYVVQSGVPIRANAVVQATLQRGYQSVGKVLEQPLVNEIVTDASYDADPNAESLAIQGFTLDPILSVAPGTKLNFTLTGSPGAKAAFSIGGVVYNVPMREVTSGLYQGQYIVQRQDNLPASGERVTATLQVDNQGVETILDQPIFAKPEPSNQVVQVISDQSLPANVNVSTETAATTGQLPIEILSPQANSQVAGTVEVRGQSAPNTTLKVSVQAFTPLAGSVGVNRNIFDRTVKTDAQGNFGFVFQPTTQAPGTRYEVNLNATDAMGQTSQKTLVLFQQ